MIFGTNWSGIRELDVLKQLINESDVEFIEILVDNFLHCSPESIKNVVGDLPVAFHIMNSQFLHRKLPELRELASQLSKLTSALNPIYISDHLGLFYFDGLPTPRMLEIDYEYHRSFVLKKLDEWQGVLDCQLLIENYPSILESNVDKQPILYKELMDTIGCGLLFDISNAHIAEVNTGVSFSDWNSLISRTSHFHIGGYDQTSFKPSFLVDTHGNRISRESLERLSTVHGIETLSVERDENFDLVEWKSDLTDCRNAASS